MILGILGLVSAMGCSIMGAHEILRRMRTGSPAVDVLIFQLLRLLLISVVVLVAGTLGVLNRTALSVVAIGGLLAFLKAGSHSRLSSDLKGIAVRGPGFALGLVVLRAVIQSWLFAPNTVDVLSYHLPKIAEWVRAGRLCLEGGLDPYATFPAGFELIETWWVIFLRHDALIELAGVEFLLLGFCAARALAEGLGVGRHASLAGLLYVLTPGVNMQAVSCLNDAPVAALVVATFALALSAAPTALTLLAFGLGLGMKPTFLFAAPGMAMSWVLFRPGARLSAGRVSWTLALSSLGVGGTWYVRNWMLYGNPFYPIGSRAFVIQTAPSLESLIRNLRDLVDVRIYDPAPYSAYMDQSSGWGPVAVGCGLLALLLSVRRSRSFAKAGVCFLVSLLGCLCLVASDDWYLRFVLFFPALLAVAVADRIENLRGMRPMMIACGCYAFLATFLPYDVPPDRVAAFWSQGVRLRSAAPFFNAPDSDGPVGYLADSRGPAYVLYGPDFRREVVYIRASSADQLLEELTRRNARQLYVAKVSGDRRDAVLDAVQRGRLFPLNENLFQVK